MGNKCCQFQVFNYTQDDIYVRVAEERSHLTENTLKASMKASFGDSLGAHASYESSQKYEWSAFVKEGFIKLASRSMHPFETGSDSVCYLTIASGKECLCQNYRIPSSSKGVVAFDKEKKSYFEMYDRFENAQHRVRELADDYAFDEYMKQKATASRSNSSKTKHPTNSLIVTRKDWSKGNVFKFSEIESFEMAEHKEYDILSLAENAGRELLQTTHSRSEGNWSKIQMKNEVSSGLQIFEHIDNKNSNSGDHYIHRGQVTVHGLPQDVFKRLSDPLFRFKYDEAVDTVELIEKLDGDIYIVRLIHKKKQCLLKTVRETMIVVRNTVVVPREKYVISAISTQHPAFPTVNGKSIQSNIVRTNIKASGWIIEKDIDNKGFSKVTHITNIDFGGNVPPSMKKDAAQKQPLAAHRVAKYFYKQNEI